MEAVTVGDQWTKDGCGLTKVGMNTHWKVILTVMESVVVTTQGALRTA